MGEICIPKCGMDSFHFRQMMQRIIGVMSVYWDCYDGHEVVDDGAYIYYTEDE
jgi:hypothetical protein